MFKNRLFLYGLGTGLVVGAILLQLMFKVDELENRPLDQTAATTVEQLQTLADPLHYKVVPKEQQSYAEADIEAIKQKAAEDERSRLAKQTPPQVPATAETPPAAPVRTVYISERMDASQVAELFEKANILPAGSGLIAGLRDKNLTTRIRPGVYSFQGTVTVDDVIAQITIQ